MSMFMDDFSGSPWTRRQKAYNRIPAPHASSFHADDFLSKPPFSHQQTHYLSLKTRKKSL